MTATPTAELPAVQRQRVLDPPLVVEQLVLQTSFLGDAVLTTPLITTSSGEKMGKTASGAIWLNKSQETLAQLQPDLVALREVDPDLNVLVRGDAKTKYRQIREVLDACQSANLPKVDLVTEPFKK